MSRRGENIYKRKDGRWEGRYIKSRTPDGKAFYGYVYDTTYSGVKYKLQCAQAQSQISFSTDTFGNAAAKWLFSLQNTVKESTHSQYYNRLQKHILPYFGDKNCCHITQQDLTAFVTAKISSDNRDPLSPKTIKDLLSIIKLVIAQTDYPPLLNFANVKVKDMSANIRVLSLTEQKRLEDELLSDMTIKKFAVLLSLYTGIRVGELCALTAKDVDLQNGSLHINKTMQRITNIGGNTKTKLIVDAPKSLRSIREIPFPSFIIGLAKPFCNMPHNANFLTGNDSSVIEPRSMQRFFENIAKKTKITDVSIHTLRHTFATRYIEQGFDVKSLSELLGHSSVNITLNRYVHPSFDLKKSNMDKLQLVQ